MVLYQRCPHWVSLRLLQAVSFTGACDLNVCFSEIVSLEGYLYCRITEPTVCDVPRRRYRGELFFALIIGSTFIPPFREILSISTFIGSIGE